MPEVKDHLPERRLFNRRLHRATNTLVLSLGLPMLVLLGLIGFVYQSASWLDHSDRAIAEANRVQKQLLLMQTAFRGFRLANDERYLQSFGAAREEFPARLDILRALTADNPANVLTLATLGREVGAWLDFVDGQLAGVRSGRLVVNDPTFLEVGSPLFQRSQITIDAFIGREEQLRAGREERMQRWVVAVLTGFGLVALLGIPLLANWLGRLLREVSGSYATVLGAAENRARELEVTLNSIGDAVVATDSRGRVEFLNSVAESLMGWTNGEARGRPLSEVFKIFNEYSGAPVEDPVAKALQTGVVVGLANHTVLRARDGTERAIEDSAAPIRDDRGKILGVILVFHDVTQKRDKERQVQENEERFRLLNELGEATRSHVDPVQIMAISTRLLGTHLRASRCAYAEVEADREHFTILQDYTDGCASTTGSYLLSLFGRRAVANLQGGQTLVVRDVNAELAPTDGADMFNAIGIQAIVTYPLIKDGSLRAMMAVHQSSPRRWSAAEVRLVGEIVERCWATIERARAEDANAAAMRALAESAERFRLLAEVVSLQVWTANVAGELDYANHECAEYFGADVQRDVLGNAWAQFVHPDDLPFAVKTWQASLASGQRYEVEFRLRGRDGRFRWFLVRAQAMRDREGRIAKWFGTNTDIDALKLAQDKAVSASRAKDDFIAALSHELRTPLTPVLMTAAALRNDDRLPAEAREQLGMIERNIALEARLIDDLLDVTTITSGKLRLRAQLSDAHSLIGLSMEIVRDEALTKEIVIERQLVASRSGLMVDPARFQQVIWNLLRNAVKFTPRGGRISLQTRDHAGPDGQAWMLIEVTDSGIGINPAQLEKIFLPFEQAERAGDHRFGGLGLGLAIARAIVELHGGRISARSAGVDQGATFSIELPGAIEAPSGVSSQQGTVSPTETATATAPTHREKSLRLLLVEDHEATLQVLERLLTGIGHRVKTARTITAALAAAAGDKFDLVISDLGLPDGTGVQLMEKLRETSGLRGIALSGYGMEEDIARSREAGFVAHLVKPVDFAQLRRVLAEIGS